jgi:mycothiol synthase
VPARLRPPHDADADAVLALIIARDIADIGMPDFTLDDLRADWATPGVDLEHDARVSAPNGTIRGYAILLGDDAIVMVHPDAEGEGDGTVLRRWAEARAATGNGQTGPRRTIRLGDRSTVGQQTLTLLI